MTLPSEHHLEDLIHSLFDGNDRFRAHVLPQMADHFQTLAHGQTPHTLFVACSDSRVDPSLITQTQPGELFVIRNAGNLVPRYGDDDGSAAAVEYAVQALSVNRIVVCGHSGCGAMGGLLEPKSLNTLPTVARWVEFAAPTRVATSAHACADPVAHAVQHNAITQLDNLLTHPSVLRAVASRGLELEAWSYDMLTGHVHLLPTSDGTS